MSYWNNYHDHTFRFDTFSPGSRVLDVGFGSGGQLAALHDKGCHAVGLDVGKENVKRGHGLGFTVVQASAEALPFSTSRFDGVICKVVLPYTDERLAVEEWSRVLKPGGKVLASFHGSGYYLRYLLAGKSLAERAYGLRSLVSGWYYGLFGKRLPMPIGDTIFQRESALERYYRQSGLEILHKSRGRTYLGLPVFFYHLLSKRE